MKIAIIGAGNMGSAITIGLINGNIIKADEITVSNPSQAKLNALKAKNANINITNDNKEAVKNSDFIILAVKPWIVEKVLLEISIKKQQVLISVAAGITFGQLGKHSDSSIAMYRVIPNTAISQNCSMTLIAKHNTTAQQDKLIIDIFNTMGVSIMVSEEKMAAATAVSSCGIAYVLKYIQAAMQAGIELGLSQKEALLMVSQSVKGAASLIIENNSHPAIEIDKVTTPGGLTIKGINELEHNNFSSAVIKAIKTSI